MTGLREGAGEEPRGECELHRTWVTAGSVAVKGRDTLALNGAETALNDCVAMRFMMELAMREEAG